MNAIQKPNLHYHVCSAEQTPFPDNSFDLVTSATAVHWFHFDNFFREIKRVGKKNSLFACWGYKVFRTDQPRLDELIDTFYCKTIHPYWDAERRHVDEEYQNIPFPFEEIKNPGFATRLTWGLEMLQGYLDTWSAVQHYIQKNKFNPVNELMDQIRSEFGEELKLQITFPVFMRMGIIKR